MFRKDAKNGNWFESEAICSDDKKVKTKVFIVVETTMKKTKSSTLAGKNTGWVGIIKASIIDPTPAAVTTMGILLTKMLKDVEVFDIKFDSISFSILMLFLIPSNTLKTKNNDTTIKENMKIIENKSKIEPLLM